MVFGSNQSSAKDLDELKHQVQELQSGIQEIQKSKANQADIEGLIKQIHDLKKSRDHDIHHTIKEASTFAKNGIESLSARIAQQFLEIEEEHSKMQEELRKQAITNKELREMVTEEDARLDQEVAVIKEDFEKFFQNYGNEIASSIIEQRMEIDSCIKKVEDREEADFNMVKKMEEADHEMVEKLEQMEKSLETRVDRLERHGSLPSNTIRHDDIAAEIKHLKDMNGDTKMGGVSEERIVKLEAEATRLASAMSEVENLATKTVHWVINNASDLKCGSDSADRLHASWFSPKFDACGCYGLQLELQLFRPEETGKQDLGNLAAFLWACKGMTIAFRISIGNKSLSLEKTFNGRVSCGTPRLCWLNEQINTSDDTLTVAVEILETFREIEHPIQASPLPEETPERQRSMKGSLLFKRHVSHRVLDQVKKEVEVMRSRMVKKIDWKVSNASSLRQSFPKNKAVCSSHFNAAGIEGFQFVFYPSGYSSATNGYCSLYVYGPIGATVRCFLSLGKQKRQISHSFNEPGAFGRTNFVSWEESGVAEADDTILIRLEIEEAHQDTHVKGQQAESSSADSVLKLVRASSKPTSGGPTPESVAAAPGLDNHLVLPSLWTSNRLGDKLSPRDPYHRFDELPSPKHSSHSHKEPSQNHSHKEPSSQSRQKEKDSSSSSPSKSHKEASPKDSSKEIPSKSPTSVETPTVASSSEKNSGDLQTPAASKISSSASAISLQQSSPTNSNSKRPASAAATRRRAA